MCLYFCVCVCFFLHFVFLCFDKLLSQMHTYRCALQMCSVQMSYSKCVLTNVFCSDELSQMRTYRCAYASVFCSDVLSPNAYLQMCFTNVFCSDELPQMRTYRCVLQMCSVQMRCPKMRSSKLAYL